MQLQYLADKRFTTEDSTVWDRLPSVTSPVLLLDGALDVAVPPDNAALIAAQIPGARSKLFPGRGHNMLVGDAADDLVAEVARFLGGEARQ